MFWLDRMKKHPPVSKLRHQSRCPGHKALAHFAQVFGSVLRDMNAHIFHFFLRIYEAYSLPKFHFPPIVLSSDQHWGISVFGSWVTDPSFQSFTQRLKISAEVFCCTSGLGIWRTSLLVCANGKVNILNNWRAAILAHIKCPACPASHLQQGPLGDLQGRLKEQGKHTLWGTRKAYSLCPQILSELLTSCVSDLFSQSECLYSWVYFSSMNMEFIVSLDSTLTQIRVHKHINPSFVVCFLFCFVGRFVCFVFFLSQKFS